MKSWMWVIIVVIIVIAGGLIYYAATQNSCKNTSTKTYLKSGSSCLINFLCIQGTEAFKDSCGCGCEKISQENQTAPNTHNIEMNNFAFFPTSLTIHPGETVTWTNKDSVPHTITSDSGAELGSSTIATGKTYSHQFNTAGTFTYHCSIHPSMKATIIVQ